METVILIALFSLMTLQIALLFPVVRRLITEMIVAIEMWAYGLGWEFDWSYVIHNTKN